MNAATTRTTHAAMLRNDALAKYALLLTEIRTLRRCGAPVDNLWSAASNLACNEITKADNFEDAGNTDLLDERREIWRG